MTDIAAIRQLLISDSARMRLAEHDVAATREKLDAHPAPAEASHLRDVLRFYEAEHTSARVAFSARAELLEHVDLDGLTVDDIVHQVVTAPGGGTSPTTPGEARTLPPTGQAAAIQ